ncbi:hypothetical protein TNCV_3648881 [Trichonephila clavipes]|nr:hypothetical protein TNCV_3648881 [Trichonephila clavipes]
MSSGRSLPQINLGVQGEIQGYSHSFLSINKRFCYSIHTLGSKENRHMFEQLFIDRNFIYRLHDESIITQCKERMMVGHQQNNVFGTFRDLSLLLDY